MGMSKSGRGYKIKNYSWELDWYDFVGWKDWRKRARDLQKNEHECYKKRRVQSVQATLTFLYVLSVRPKLLFRLNCLVFGRLLHFNGMKQAGIIIKGKNLKECTWFWVRYLCSKF